MQKSILTITTNPCIDRTVWVNELVPEKKLRATNTEVEPGGGGINVARAIKEMQGKPTALFTVGAYTGNYFNELMEAESIDCERIFIEQPTRENTLIIDNKTLLEYRIGMAGPELLQTEQEAILKVLQSKTNFNFWILSGSLNPKTAVDFYVQIAKLAIQNHVQLIVDTSGEALQNLLQLPLFLAKPNLGELAAFAGKPLTTETEILQTSEKIIATSGIQNLVISAGKDGAYLITKTKKYKATPPQVQVKSTVGAGDCMVAGITYAFSKGMDTKQALMQGIACGTAATLYSGYGLCKKEDIDWILKEVVVYEL